MSVPAPCKTCGFQHIPVGDYDHEFAASSVAASHPSSTSTDTKIEEILERFMYSFTHLDDPMDLRQTTTALKTLLTSEKKKSYNAGWEAGASTHRLSSTRD